MAIFALHTLLNIEPPLYIALSMLSCSNSLHKYTTYFFLVQRVKNIHRQNIENLFRISPCLPEIAPISVALFEPKLRLWLTICRTCRPFGTPSLALGLMLVHRNIKFVCLFPQKKLCLHFLSLSVSLASVHRIVSTICFKIRLRRRMGHNWKRWQSNTHCLWGLCFGFFFEKPNIHNSSAMGWRWRNRES
jgi:hypothetical protein